MMLPQRPYFPIGSLHARSSIPAKPSAFSPDQVGKCSPVGLPQLAERLDEEAHWNRMLSLGEQQRLGLARALLHAPQYLFLDEATASLDEPSEAALYRCSRRSCRQPPSSRSATARRWTPSTSAMSRWCATAIASRCRTRKRAPRRKPAEQ
jgi:ABC-type uncharacterized transport system fused permease/ATPase subunit